MSAMPENLNLGRPLSAHGHPTSVQSFGPGSTTIGKSTNPSTVYGHNQPSVSRASVASRIPTRGTSLDQEREYGTHNPPDLPRDSESTVRSDSENTEQHRKRRDKELGESSETTLERAAIAGVAGVGTAEGARAILAHGSNKGIVPNGWEEVQMEDKNRFWSASVKKERKTVIFHDTKGIARILVVITLWLWVCMPIFWGSTYKLEDYFSNLNIHVVTFDTNANAVLGPALINAANTQAALPSSTPHLGWQVLDSSYYPNGLGDVENDVIGQGCWGAVVVNANATTAYLDALTNGDASYDPNGAIGVYMASARFYQVTLLYVKPLILATVSTALTSARATAYQNFITANANNPTALANAARVPQAIGTAYGYTIHDLRSIGNYQWSAAAPMEASLIYFVIFAFYIALFSAVGRMKSGLGNKLKFSSFFGLRLGWPLVAYIFISLWQTLVVRAFQVPLEDYLGRAGFVVLWALNYVTLVAGGLAMETALAIVGLTWLPFFLILWIILNITSSFFPLEIMPTFYHFFRWLPFLHNVEGYKIIAFGTDWNHKLGYHFGILFGIIGVELICFPLSLVFERWNADRSQLKEIKEKERKAEEQEKREHEA